MKKIAPWPCGSITRAARNGWPVFVSGFMGRERFIASLRKYRHELVAAGHAPAVLKHCMEWTTETFQGLFVAETDEQAFKDINEQPDALAAYGAKLDDVRRRLHATDENGALLVGADVAIATWRLTPGEGWLASLFGNPVALPLTRFAYDRFADLLFAWNKRKGRW